MATSKAAAVKAALYTLLAGKYAEPVQVYYGYPDTFLTEDIVSVANLRGTQQSASLGAQSREEAVLVDVVISTFRGGGSEAQQPATEQAFTLMATLEAALVGPPIGTGDPTLGGVVRFTELQDYTLTETVSEEIAEGRIAELVVVVLAHVRL